MTDPQFDSEWTLTPGGSKAHLTWVDRYTATLCGRWAPSQIDRRGHDVCLTCEKIAQRLEASNG